MTNLEIKKLYKKTKAAFERRTGRRLTWYMSGAQMANGTATICTVRNFGMDDRGVMWFEIYAPGEEAYA